MVKDLRVNDVPSQEFLDEHFGQEDQQECFFDVEAVQRARNRAFDDKLKCFIMGFFIYGSLVAAVLFLTDWNFLVSVFVLALLIGFPTFYYVGKAETFHQMLWELVKK